MAVVAPFKKPAAAKAAGLKKAIAKKPGKKKVFKAKAKSSWVESLSFGFLKPTKAKDKSYNYGFQVLLVGECSRWPL